MAESRLPAILRALDPRDEDQRDLIYELVERPRGRRVNPQKVTRESQKAVVRLHCRRLPQRVLFLSL